MVDFTQAGLDKLSEAFHRMEDGFNEAKAVYLHVMAQATPTQAGPSKYPWHELEAGSPKAFIAAETIKERRSIQKSVTAASYKRYGKGACRVAIGRNGVWITRKRDLVRIGENW